MNKIIFNFSIMIFCVILGINYFPDASFAQEDQSYQYKRKVFLVELQVGVFGKDGKFVEGLKPEDFIILDEGKQQEISHFDYVIHDEANIDLISRDSAAYKRQFLLLFDLSFSSKKGLKNSQIAGLEFVDMMLPTDWAAVITFSSFQGLKVLADFTNNKEKLKEAINVLGLKKATQLTDSILDDFGDLISGGGLISQNPELMSAGDGIEEVLDFMKEVADLTLQKLVANYIIQFKRLGEALNVIEGKKNILYFSEGFDSKVLISKPGWKNKNIAAMFNNNMDKMLKRFVGSDSKIQAIDVGGLRAANRGGSLDKTNPTPDIIEIHTKGAGSSFLFNHPGKTTLFFMANETGGEFYHNMNDFSKTLDDILESTSKYYVIGYYPAEVGKEGKFRKVKVKVNRPGLKAVARKGYYEDKPYKEYSNLEKKMHLAEVVIKDIVHNDIQFTAFPSAFPGRETIARVPIFLQFPGQQFLDKKWKKQGRLELFGYLINDAGYFKDFFNAEIIIDRGQAGKKLRGHGIKFFDMLLAPPGKHKVKLIVRDSETGEMGSRICHISVPDFQSNELAMTPPIFIDNDGGWLLSRGYDPNNPEGKKKGLPVSYPFTIGKEEFIPAVVPELKLGQPAQFCLKVYNLMLHAETKVPQTSMDFEIVYPDGSISKIQKIELVNKPAQGENNCFELLFNVIVDNHPPGDYQLKATVIDTLANKKAESLTPFILIP
jgi:VWFA-related protein